MTSRELPRRPSVEHLRNEARDLQRERKATDPDAKLSNAQLAVARSYGFPSWPKLREHVETINRYFWPPADAASDDEDVDLVDRFLADACLTYTGIDAGQRPLDAAALLDSHPELATASVHAMAAANEADALRAAIAADPTVVERPGGPHRWVPLLYAGYARVPGRSTLHAARVLLDAGADPNAGSLWDGTYPFTALTGVLGGGEEGQPRHPDGMAFARLLLEAGANPNDTQAIYNGTFLPDDSHLQLLFEFGLGTGDPGPWWPRARPRRCWTPTGRSRAGHGGTPRACVGCTEPGTPRRPTRHRQSGGRARGTGWSRTATRWWSWLVLLFMGGSVQPRCPAGVPGHVSNLIVDGMPG